MASRELNILVAAKGALQAARDLGKVDGAVSGVSRTANRVGKAAAIGIGAAVGVGAAIVGRSVKSGIENLALMEDAVTQVSGAIEQAPWATGTSAQQVATWANDIEASVDAAFDDKAITSATATLVRFGRVTPQNLRPAMVVMTDLAAKTGDVDSAAALLSKALADPTKAAGKLARVGIILTKEQQEQIKAMVKAGDTAGAQKLLLDQLADATEGAAKASAGPYRDSMNILADVTEDAQKALAVGFLPVISKVRDILTKKLADPNTLKGIEDFGKGLAGGLETLIDIAMGLPWGSIKDTFTVMGTGSKALLDAFLGLPPWVQTAVLTAWGTNKITGGLVGELGKGLIKGVLGMNAGVVNINAGAVNGAGGVPGAAAAGGGGGGKAGAIMGFLGYVGIASIAVAAGQAIADAIGATPDNPTDGASRSFYRNQENANRTQSDNEVKAQKLLADIGYHQQRLEEQGSTTAANTAKAYDAIERLRSTTSSGLSATAAAGQAAAAAIKDKDLSITFAPRISVGVSIRTFNQQAKATTKLGYVAS